MKPISARLSPDETAQVLQYLGEIRLAMNWTYAYMDERLDVPAGWSQNATRPARRNDGLMAEHAYDLLALCALEADPEELRAEARELLALPSIVAWCLEKEPTVFPPLAARTEDVPEIASTLSAYLADAGFRVPRSVLEHFFLRPADEGTTCLHWMTQAFAARLESAHGRRPLATYQRVLPK